MSLLDDRSIRKAYRPELTVLIVEDHLLFRKDIKHALPQHTVVFARSLEEARARYGECLPDIIFLDIDLPDGTGFEFLDYVHSREPDAYIVMLTGSKVEGDVVTSRQKGARGYIIKPFVKSKIEQYMAEYLQARERTIKSLIQETERNRHGGVLLLKDKDMVDQDARFNKA